VRLSILIPVYNEAHSIPHLLKRVIVGAAEPLVEVIVVDDGSRDQSASVVKAFSKQHPEVFVRLIEQPQHFGRSNAIRTAIEHAAGDFCLIQENGEDYDPADYPAVLKPLFEERADVVLGSRFASAARRPLGYRQAEANRRVTRLTASAAQLDISDIQCGIKAFRTSLARSVPLQSERLGLGPELVIQFAKRHARIVEVPVTYRGNGDGPAPFLPLQRAIRRARSAPSHVDPAADMLVSMSRANRFNRWMADVITPWVAGDVLELGAGIGNLTLLLARAGDTYTATDTDPEHLYELYARAETIPNLKLDMCDFADQRDMARYRNSADTVICLNALEHVRDDVDSLWNIRETLRPGGVAIILVPQGPQAFGSMDEVLEHKRRYTREELERKMESTGFRIERMMLFNRATWPGWYLNSKLMRRRTLSRTQLRLFDLLVPLWRRIDGRLPWPSTSLIAIGVAVE
jgi:SAM-dependent methyltransferase